VNEDRDFKFGTGWLKLFQPTEDKPSLKGMWLHHMSHIKFLGPYSYLSNGWS